MRLIEAAVVAHGATDALFISKQPLCFALCYGGGLAVTQAAHTLPPGARRALFLSASAVHFRSDFGGGERGVLFAAVFVAAAARARSVVAMFVFLLAHSARHYHHHFSAIFKNFANLGIFSATSVTSVLATNRLVRSKRWKPLIGVVLGHLFFQETLRG